MDTTPNTDPALAALYALLQECAQAAAAELEAFAAQALARASLMREWKP